MAAVSKDISQKVSALARERIGGLQSIAAEPPKPRVTWSVIAGTGVRRLAPVSGAQPDLVQLADARCAGVADALARTSPARTATARCCGSRTDEVIDRPAGARRCQSPRPADQSAVERVRRRDRRRRAGRPCGGGLRRVGRAAHDRRRARGARRAGRHVVADRELSRLSERGLGRRACQPRAAAGAAARRGNPGHALGRAHRSRRRARCSRRRRRRARADPHSRHRRLMAAPRDRRLRSAHRQGRLLRRRAQRGELDAWARRPPRRRRKLGRPGGAVLCQLMRAR